MMRGTCQTGSGGFRPRLTRLTGTMAHGNGTPGLASGRRTGDVCVGSGETPLMALISEIEASKSSQTAIRLPMKATPTLAIKKEKVVSASGLLTEKAN